MPRKNRFAPPGYWLHITQRGLGGIHWHPSAGINRHAVGNERVLQERSSEPPDLESCGGGREAAAEA